METLRFYIACNLHGAQGEDTGTGISVLYEALRYKGIWTIKVQHHGLTSAVGGGEQLTSHPSQCIGD
jgi:hypothetical protein